MDISAFHSIDPNTGMTESTGNYAQAFTPERKAQFLKAYADSGLRFTSTCKVLGISYDTSNHHIEIDPEFKANFKQAQSDYAEELEARQRAFALEPKHFMDRAMQLRALLPGRYARDERREDTAVTINISNDALIEAKRRSESMDHAIEAEIVQQQDAQKTHLNAVKSASMRPDVDNNTPQ